MGFVLGSNKWMLNRSAKMRSLKFVYKIHGRTHNDWSVDWQQKSPLFSVFVHFIFEYFVLKILRICLAKKEYPSNLFFLALSLNHLRYIFILFFFYHENLIFYNFSHHFFQIVYLGAFSCEVSWILEARGDLPYAAYVLCTQYFIVFVATTILIHGLVTGLPWGLFAWSVIIGILSIPELIFVMIMTTQHWVNWFNTKIYCNNSWKYFNYLQMF